MQTTAIKDIAIACFIRRLANYIVDKGLYDDNVIGFNNGLY